MADNVYPKTTPMEPVARLMRIRSLLDQLVAEHVIKNYDLGLIEPEVAPLLSLSITFNGTASEFVTDGETEIDVTIPVTYLDGTVRMTLNEWQEKLRENLHRSMIAQLPSVPPAPRTVVSAFVPAPAVPDQELSGVRFIKDQEQDWGSISPAAKEAAVPNDGVVGPFSTPRLNDVHHRIAKDLGDLIRVHKLSWYRIEELNENELTIHVGLPGTVAKD